MQAYPVQGGNISQMMFYQNEKSIVPSHAVSSAYQNLAALSGINSLPQEKNDMYNQMPAFLQQAHLSTYYQDNPWGILGASNKYGNPTMGGELIPDQPPGYKPGNILRRPSMQGMPSMQNRPSMQSMQKSGREHFENESDSHGFKINWQ